MAENSKIEWCDATWQVTHGCQKVSEGCANCYAIRDAHRMASHPNPKVSEPRKGLVTPDGMNWTGVVRTAPENLAKPLRWKKPKRIFVNSNSDLFHEDVPFEYIAAAFGVMAACPQHTFMVLTKRPERMKAFFDWDAGEYPASMSSRDPGPGAGILYVIEQMMWLPEIAGSVSDDLFDVGERLGGSLDRGGGSIETPSVWDDCKLPAWPLPNVWLGTSVENQEQADARIPHLLSVPAAVRFLSMEPLIGEVDLDKPRCEYHDRDNVAPDDFYGEVCEVCRADGGTGEMPYRMWLDPFPENGSHINWVIVGGESGPNARPMNPDWVRSIRDQCASAGVPFHFKQWGRWAPGFAGECHIFELGNHVSPVGKRAAGRLLDGEEHNGLPEVRA